MKLNCLILYGFAHACAKRIRKCCKSSCLRYNGFAPPLVTYFDVTSDNNEDFFLKTYLRFVMTLDHANSVIILHIHKIYFLREMSLNFI